MNEALGLVTPCLRLKGVNPRICSFVTFNGEKCKF